MQILEFTGHLHPLLVHLPIGFLLLALVLQWLSRKEAFEQLAFAARIGYGLGMMSALCACISGWILSGSGEYDATVLDWHRWMGISVALVSFIAYRFSGYQFMLREKVTGIILLLLITITGHLGGTLTHGEGYLTKGLSVTDKDTVKTRILPADPQEALVYADLVKPLLDQKCGTCHSAVKQKGGLRLDAEEWIRKGGKDGLVWKNGDAAGSELYHRVVLDPLEEKHMPPKGKPQLTETEKALLAWWISSEAGFGKMVKEVKADPVVNTYIQSISKRVSVTNDWLPKEKVNPVSAAVLDSLQHHSIAVTPVAAGSNYMQLNYVSIPKPSPADIALLDKVKEQLVSLKLGHAELKTADWRLIGACEKLVRLSIEHTSFSDADMQWLLNLKQLRYLNLSGTKITAKGVTQLKTLPVLQEVYLDGTGITPAEIRQLQALFPKAKLDSGHYTVSTLPTDTQLLKAPVKKK
jgi:uncharacterized membrane protein/mono/diheme cytochrome c family protein